MTRVFMAVLVTAAFYVVGEEGTEQGAPDAGSSLGEAAVSPEPEDGSEREAPEQSERIQATLPVVESTAAPHAGELVCGQPPGWLTPAPAQPVPVIFDTDFGPDVDDVGALAILHVMADRSEADILAVMVSTTDNGQASQSVDVVNTYYGRPDIPIGIADASAPSIPSRFTTEIAASFENDEQANRSATSLYREVLAAQPDGSVTIVSVGFASNLDDLLLSEPDEHSELNGADLVAKKVRLWVAMAGHFPDSASHPTGSEWNVVVDRRAAIISTATWPTPAVFSGYEVGSEIHTGGILATTVPEESPVREAYRLYTGGDDRESWDLTAVWYAVRGPTEFFDTCFGRIQVRADGSNGWDSDAEGHAFIRMKAEAEVIAAALDELLVTPPGDRRNAVGTIELMKGALE